MPPHLDSAAILVTTRAGQGTIVIVEGETSEDDEYFFKRWFGGLATQVSFFAQNGWTQVARAVADLRQQMPYRKIFGIVDRDFAADSVLAAQQGALPPDGILRTKLYTIENYLLAAAGWHPVVLALTRHNAPAGWATEADINARIEESYKRCVPLAAHNAVVHDENARTSGPPRKYADHVLAVPEPRLALATWGQSRVPGPPAPLEQAYDARRADFDSRGYPSIAEVVSGKMVLQDFLHTMNRAVQKRLPVTDLVSLYIERYPAPPAELEALVRRLI